MQVMDRNSGFSLIEAVVASAVLLLTCVAVGGTLSAGLRAERATRQRADLESVLAAESARLASLPFFVQAAPPSPGDARSDLSPASLLAVVFPHARPEFNSTAARYCDGRGSGAPGSFVTLIDSDGVALRRETRFVVGQGTDWEGVMPAALDGWAVWEDRPVPASTVEIALSVRCGSRDASTSLILRAVRVRVAPPSAPDAGGSHGG
jgi:hypothetical protein